MNRDRLKQEPSGDLISREETLTAFADYVGSGMSMDDYDALWNIVAKMPPANHQETVTEFADRCRECGREKVLDKIRAEIKTMSGDIETIADVLKIIDKYKT